MKEQAAKKAADDIKVERATRREAQHPLFDSIFKCCSFYFHNNFFLEIK